MQSLRHAFNLTYDLRTADPSLPPADSSAGITATLLLAPHLPTLLFHHALAITLASAKYQQVVLIAPRVNTPTNHNNNGTKHSTPQLPYYTSPHGHPLLPPSLSRIHIRRIPPSLDALRALLAWLPHVDPPVGVATPCNDDAGHAVAGIIVEDFGRWFEVLPCEEREREPMEHGGEEADDDDEGFGAAARTDVGGVRSPPGLWDLAAQMVAALIELTRWYAAQAGNG
ncbi:hypothetical protein HDU86_002641 [Geranomyces michiganensis]|nr:hypothetical protein HDU86_002641 [Geranomyces michiganensis]